MAGNILFDNNVLPVLLGSDSEARFNKLATLLAEHYPHLKVHESSLGLGALVPPSAVVEILDIPKTLSVEPNHKIEPKDRLKDFRERCIQEHRTIISDKDFDEKISAWVSKLPNTRVATLIRDPFLDFLSTGKHNDTIRDYLAIHRLLGFNYPDKNEAQSYLLAQSISALNRNGFVPLLRLAKGIATALGSTKEGRSYGWYDNPDLQLKSQGDHLDTELIQTALFGIGPNATDFAVCVTKDPAKKLRARIKLIMQVLVEYQSWAQDQPELESAPDPIPGFIAVCNEQLTEFVDLIDVRDEIKPFMNEEASDEAAELPSNN